MKEYTKDLGTVGELVAGKNFITDPLLPPGGLPGKLTGEEMQGSNATGILYYLCMGVHTLAIPTLEVEAGGSEIQGSSIHGKFKASLRYIRSHLKNSVCVCTPYHKL